MHIKLCDGCIVDYSAAMFLEKNNNDRDMSIKGFLLSHRVFFFFPFLLYNQLFWFVCVPTNLFSPNLY